MERRSVRLSEKDLIKVCQPAGQKESIPLGPARHDSVEDITAAVRVISGSEVNSGRDIVITENERGISINVIRPRQN